MTSVNRTNVAAAMPIVDEEGAIAIFQAAQLELADTLTNGLSMRIAQMAELAARLRSAPTLAGRLQAQKPPDPHATIGVLGNTLEEANALWSELDALGLPVDSPVSVPVLKYDKKDDQLKLVWMTPEQRSALSGLPKLNNAGLVWNAVVAADPNAAVLDTWGTGELPRVVDQRTDGHGVDYYIFDERKNRPVSVGDLDRFMNLLPEAIERCTAQLEGAKFNAQDDIAALGDVITDANQTAVKRHTDAHARTLDTSRDARLAEDRALQRRRDDANPVVKPPSPDTLARAERTEPRPHQPQPTSRGRRNG